MANLHIVDASGPVVKIALHGRMDMGGVEQMEAQFAAAAGRPPKPVIVDLTGVAFISSIGLRLFLAVAKDLAQNGAKLALYGPTEKVNAILTTVGLRSIIPVFASEAEARQAVLATTP